MRIAINGFGRIGRAVFRIAETLPDVEVGRFPGEARIEGDRLLTPGGEARMFAERAPEKLPWGELGVDAVVEATGVFRAREEVARHLTAGARRAVLTVPAKDAIDLTVVLGVNEDALVADHRIVSNASCTTNCLAPLARVLHESFGIREGFVNTVHAYTNDQRLADVPHSDWRRSRAAAENIIPTSTGAAKAVGEVLPELKGRLDGIASRVPVPDGSVVDLFVELERDTTVEEVHEVLRTAAASPRLAGILEFSTAPLVSSDIIGNPHSSIFDAAFTQVVGGRFLKVLSWYDNEWGYSNRVCDLLRRLDALDAPDTRVGVAA
jgi:glyceraldehyde 3-phosphate dehydrogenase